MSVKQILKDHDIDTNMLRWYLSFQQMQILMEMKKDPDAMCKYIWSKQLEDRLYDMEDRFFADLEEDYRKGIKTENDIEQLARKIVFIHTRIQK